MSEIFQGYPINEGDRVWSVTQGWGTVKDVRSPDATDYPLRVIFDNTMTASTTFTLDGIQFLRRNEKPALFWNEIKFDKPIKPCPPVMEYNALLHLHGTNTVAISRAYFTTKEEATSTLDPEFTVLALIKESGKVRVPK